MPKFCEYMDPNGNRCKKCASYGIDSIIRCATHKELNMKYRGGKYLCKCGKFPSFGFVKDSLPSCCKLCKTTDMVNIKSRKCIVCKERCPSFGKKGCKYTHCSICKEPDMIDVKHFKCIQCETKIPIFGISNGKATHCSDCKLFNMIDVSNKKCPCGKNPYFGYPDNKSKRASHCSKCKEPGMIDIRHSKCKCGKSASFGFQKSLLTCCSNCKEDGMIELGRQKCPCGKNPYFGYPNDKSKRASHCSKCKEPGMIDIKTKKCKANDIPYNIPCFTTFNRNYDGFCTHCFSHLFPNHPKTFTIRKKSKELQVISYLSDKYTDFLHDKPLYVDLNGGCCPSKRRIDLRKLINNTLLCIEIDEHQHKSYCEIDEINRYNDLFMDFSGKYIFIRYNPDNYQQNGKNKNPRFSTRMTTLITEIERHITRIQEEENKDLIEVYYLFYNKA